MTIHIGDTALQTLLAPVAPFQRRRPARDAQQLLPARVIEGVRPPGSDDANVKYKGPLQYKVPTPWRETCRLGEAADLLAAARAALSPATLPALYHQLLWTEELQMDKDIRGYSVDNKRLVHDRAFLELDVPGLAEKRPSVLKGDSVLVHHPGQPAGEIVKYKGYVHDVMRDKVKLKFDPGFHRSYVNGQLVNVEFTYNRMTLRICHQSVDTLTPQLTAHILPSAASPDYPLALNPVTIYPVNRALNEQQMLAVKRIVQKSNINRNCPYIIYGPPGTGTVNYCLL